MARTARVKLPERACYHVMTRINNKAMLLAKAETKDIAVTTLERAAAFSGADILGFAIMDNHIHIVCNIGKDPLTAPLSEDEVLRRIECLRGASFRAELERHLDALRKAGKQTDAESLISRYRRRMNDLSEFMKTYLETFGREYRLHNEFTGHLWEDRYKSVLIEDERQLRICLRYVELNPVRAALASTPESYAWCTAGAASNPASPHHAFAQKCRRASDRLILGTDPNDASTASAPQLGTDPNDATLLHEIPQLVSGIVLGSQTLMQRILKLFPSLAHKRKVAMRHVTEGVYSFRGHRLARRLAQRAS